jgi:hypothetical protein
MASLVSIIRDPQPIQVTLRDIKRTADDWADRLLFAGIVSGYSYEGEKKFRDSADRIGKALRFQGELAARVGAFGIEIQWQTAPLNHILPRERRATRAAGKRQRAVYIHNKKNGSF